MAFDSAQNLYVADSQNDAIREIDHTSGLVSTVAGSLGVAGNTGDNGPATSATLNDPEAIAIDQFDEVFIADAGNCRVRWIDTSAGMNAIAAPPAATAVTAPMPASPSSATSAAWRSTPT